MGVEPFIARLDDNDVLCRAPVASRSNTELPFESLAHATLMIHNKLLVNPFNPIYPHIISHSIHIVIPLQRLNPFHIQVIKHALLENIPVSLDCFPPFSHLVRGLRS